MKRRFLVEVVYNGQVDQREVEFDGDAFDLNFLVTAQLNERLGQYEAMKAALQRRLTWNVTELV